MVAILNQGPSDGTGRRGKVLRLYRLTLNQKDNQGPQTIQEYSYPKVRPWMNNRRCLNSIQQQVLYPYNFQDRMYNHVGILLAQLNCNIRHRNLIEGLRLKIWLGELSKYHDSRVTIFCLGIIETEQNLWNRFVKSIARRVTHVKRHIRLSYQLASNNFAQLNMGGHKFELFDHASKTYFFTISKIPEFTIQGCTAAIHDCSPFSKLKS